MKKFIALLLALVLALGLVPMASAVDMPAECAEDKAGVIVTTEGSTDKYYFETLNQAVIDWVFAEIPGAPTFTVMKDLTIKEPEGSYIALNIPANLAQFYNKNPLKKLPVTFDLNGHTLSYKGEANMFYMIRFGMTMKNGTLLYDGTKATRAVFCIGGTKTPVATSDGKEVYAPELILENVNALNVGEGGAVLNSYIYAPKITAKNSVLWSYRWDAINVSKSNQADQSKVVYEGAYTPSFKFENSILGTGEGFGFAAGIGGSVFDFTDSALVINNASGLMMKASSVAEVVLDGKELVEKNDWTTTLVNGKSISGKAFVFGKDPAGETEAPAKVELPFTDVKEGDWFYEFVSEMYGKKIIAGQTATTFNPNGNLTYGAALKLLTVGVTGKDVGNATSGHWATNYLNEAVSAGWTTIGADKLDAPVTREAFCEIAAKAKNLTEKAENPFKDTNNDAVLALVKAGVISGMSADTFNPAGVLTRAQIAKIISLLIKL